MAFTHRFLAALLAAALIPSLAAADPTLTVTKPWVRYLLPSVPAAAYMTVHNNAGAAATLTAAASPACGMLMLHQSQDSSGMAMMMDVPSISIPAHGSVTLAPGGYHLMCMTPSMKVGDIITLTLTFQDGTKLNIPAQVYGAQSSP